MGAIVHDTVTCRRERRSAMIHGVWIGAAICAVIAAMLGGVLTTRIEGYYDSAFARIQAQHRLALEVERKRVARYAEIDLLAKQYDAMQGRE